MPDAPDYIKQGNKALQDGRLAEAEAFFGLALEAGETCQPGGSSSIAEASFFLSQVKYRLGDWDSAERLTRRAMGIWNDTAGSESMPVASCLNNLGRIYEERGLLDEGIMFHRASLEMRRKIFGDHVETAFALGNLGTALATNGEWEEAATVLAECIDLYTRMGVTAGVQLDGYRHNLEVCLKALADHFNFPLSRGKA